MRNWWSGGLQGTGRRRILQLGDQEDYQSRSLGKLLRERDLNTELEGWLSTPIENKLFLWQLNVISGRKGTITVKSAHTLNSAHICSHEAFAGVFKNNAKKYNTAFHSQISACQCFQSLRHELPAGPSSHLWCTLVVQDVVLRYWERSWLISDFSTGRKNNTVGDKDPITSHCMCLTALECHCCFKIYKSCLEKVNLCIYSCVEVCIYSRVMIPTLS